MLFFNADATTTRRGRPVRRSIGAIPVEVPPLIEGEVEGELGLVPKPSSMQWLKPEAQQLDYGGTRSPIHCLGEAIEVAHRSRGTPKPADPGLMVRRLGAPTAGFAARRVPPHRLVPAHGGVGLLFGPVDSLLAEFHIVPRIVVARLPTHPKPGMKAQLP